MFWSAETSKDIFHTSYTLCVFFTTYNGSSAYMSSTRQMAEVLSLTQSISAIEPWRASFRPGRCLTGVALTLRAKGSQRPW